MRVGTAGWGIAQGVAEIFPGEGSGLERYSSRLSCSEINSSFHRSHRASTWSRWAEAVPAGFRFSAKLAKEITHKRRLVGCEALVEAAVGEMLGLGDKLEIVLVQLPPSLAFDASVAQSFFAALRESWRGKTVCEPRHPSWFEADADRMLDRLSIARVAADPAPVEAAARPGGWRGLCYWRLHGSPVAYRSSYDDGRLEAYAEAVERERRAGSEVWCIFDNTAGPAATGNALKLQALLCSGAAAG